MIIIAGKFSWKDVKGKVSARPRESFELGTLSVTFDALDPDIGHKFRDAFWNSGMGVGIGLLPHEHRFIHVISSEPIACHSVRNGNFNDNDIFADAKKAFKRLENAIPGLLFSDLELYHIFLP